MAVDWEKFAVDEEKKPAEKIDWENFAISEKPKSLKDMFIAALQNAAAPSKHYPFNVMKQVAAAAPILGEDIGNIASETGKTISEGAAPAIAQKISHPVRALENELGGLAEAGRGVINVAHDLPEYLAHLKLVDPQLAKQVSSVIPHMPELESTINKMIGENPDAADKYIRGLFKIMPIGLPGGSAGKAASVLGKEARIAADEIGSGVAQGAKVTSQGVFGKNDPVLKAKILENEIAIPEAEQKAKQAAMEHEQQSAEHAENVAGATRELNLSNPEKMEFRRNEQLKQLDQLRNESEQLNQQLAEIPAHAEAPQHPGKASQAHAEAEEQAAQHEANVLAAEAHHANANALTEHAENTLGNYLNAEGAHDVEASAALAHRGQAIEDYVKNRYENFVKKIQDVNFHIPEAAMANLSDISPTELVKTYGREAFEAIKKGKMDEFIAKQNKKEMPDNVYLNKLMELTPNSRDVNAANFLLKRRAFRDELFNLKQKIRKDKFTALEEEKAREAVKKGEEIKSHIEKVIEEGLGEFKPEFDEVNKLYSEQIYPLRENPVMEAAREGNLSKNIVYKLRTNEEGMPFVRELVKQDRNLLRNVIGQRYAAKPSEVHHPNAMMREYINADPELQGMIDTRNESHQLAQQAESQVSVAKRRHGEAKQNEASAAKASKAEEAEFRAALKKYNAETNQNIKTREELSERLGKIAEESAEIEQKIPLLEKHVQVLRESAQNKNISLKEKLKHESQIADLRKELSALRKQKVKNSSMIKKAYYMGKGLLRLGMKFTKGL